MLPAMTKQLVFVKPEELLRLLVENSIALPQNMRLPMETLVHFPLSSSNPGTRCPRRFQSDSLPPEPQGQVVLFGQPSQT